MMMRFASLLLAATAVVKAQETVTAVDFLVTSNNVNASDTSQHFVARIVDATAIEQARDEIDKEEEGWMVISGIIDKSPIDWNPGWSFHFKPETVIFGEMFFEVCDATVDYVEDHLDDAGGAFLPNLQWCPWGTRVLEELGETEIVLMTQAPTTAVGEPVPPSAPEFAMAVDFLVTSNALNASDTSEHYVARILDATAIEQARGEIDKEEEEGWMIISGIIDKSTIDWNPDWSFHFKPETVIFGDVFTEVCDATVDYVEDHLDEAGGAFLPGLRWCPWRTRVLQELQEVNISVTSAPTTTTMEPTPEYSYIEPKEAVDFLITTFASNMSNTAEHFVVRITDQNVIAAARAELNKTEGFKLVAGFIVKQPAEWNFDHWSYYIKPDSVLLEDVFTEVCDATATYVEDHLDEAGGAFLPGLQWCPWDSRVLQELHAIDLTPPSPTPGNPTVQNTPPPVVAPSTTSSAISWRSTTATFGLLLMVLAVTTRGGTVNK